MNAFESLCILASREDWCWKIHCSTCGHLHFRYSFQLIAKGVNPEEIDWPIHRNKTHYHSVFGPLPISFTSEQINHLHKTCLESSIIKISQECTFPDWLGYIGLVIHHTFNNSESAVKLSRHWALQLQSLVPDSHPAYFALDDIVNGEESYLTLKILEQSELALNII